jgi:hypothetical protein
MGYRRSCEAFTTALARIATLVLDVLPGVLMVTAASVAAATADPSGVNFHNVRWTVAAAARRGGLTGGQGGKWQ